MGTIVSRSDTETWESVNHNYPRTLEQSTTEHAELWLAAGFRFWGFMAGFELWALRRKVLQPHGVEVTGNSAKP